MSDLAAMIELFRQTVRLVNSRDYNPGQIDAWLSSAADVSWTDSFFRNTAIVADVDGRLAGFADIEASGRLNRLYVDAELIGQGVGSKLLAAIEQLAIDVGHTRITTEASETARPFFARRGFHVLCRNIVLRTGVELHNYVMEKPLPAQIEKPPSLK